MKWVLDACIMKYKPLGPETRFTKIVTNKIFVSFYVSLKKVYKCVLLKKFVSDSSLSFYVTLRKKKLAITLA